MGISRRTKSVDLITKEFESISGAISTTELIDRLSEQINKTTIYRVLEKLEDDGYVHSFLGKQGITWYAKCDNCTGHYHHDEHPHFQCTECGKVDCLPITVQIPKIEDRTIDKTNVLILGKCNMCL